MYYMCDLHCNKEFLFNAIISDLRLTLLNITKDEVLIFRAESKVFDTDLKFRISSKKL